MSLLTNHLDSLRASSTSISTLIFPPPKIFTNALLHPTEITNLIRDTEIHERALFSVPPPSPQTQSTITEESDPPAAGKSSKRRQTVFNVQAGEVEVSASAKSRSMSRKNTVVASVLGGELHDELKREKRGGKEVDVDILLFGVERLLEVYEVEGGRERVGEARRRKGVLERGIERYSRLVGELEERGRDEEDDGEYGTGRQGKRWGTMNDPWRNRDGEENSSRVTLAMVQGAQREVRELEMRKRRLEERLEGMERDLGGLAR